jgi:2-polyprenyl-6-methoxyphenol hydroxylase-like FAD-dependent oxidoreductase
MTASDVTIIGAGPVGLGLAIDLAQRGTSVTLVEKYPHPQRIPKGQNLTQRSGEHFQAWGVSDAIRAATPIPPEYGNEGLVAYGSLFSGYHYDWFKRASVREYYAADNERLPQYETENVLRNRVAELDNIYLLAGWAFDSYSEIDSQIHTIIKQTDSDNTSTLQSSYLVGCDGARSNVRDACGITQTVDQHGRRMALLVFNSTELHELLEKSFPGKTIFNTMHPDLNGYWQFLGRVDLESNWFFHAPVPDDADIDNYDFTALLLRAVGAEFSARIDYKGFWDLRFTHADTYQTGRVFIAGDAAHSHPPYGGYGVNTGFEDVRNLSWKLSSVLKGNLSPDILDSYTSERHPVFASTRDNFIARMINSDASFLANYQPEKNKSEFEEAWKKRAAGGQSEVQGYVPHYEGSPIVYSSAPVTKSMISSNQTALPVTPGAVGLHSHKAYAGAHLSPQVLSDGRNIYSVLDEQHTLILISSDENTTTRDQFEKAAITARLPLSIVTSTPNENTERWEASIIIVRPDQFIAYASNELDVDPTQLLMHLAGYRIQSSSASILSNG